jgi:hypothetical protein
MTPSQVDPAEVALVALLDALASVLIQLEITPARVAQILRTSFVKSGANRARKRTSDRPHLAKIAALTGLSRVEVKRIVAANFATATIDPESFPRALRVLRGWKTSPVYSNRGIPKRLPIAGRSPSFYSLCKAFSGDIPHTVILDELEQQRRVVVSKNREMVALAKRQKYASKNRQEHDALLFAAAFLSDALRLGTGLVRRREKIAASRNVSNAYIENAVVGRVTELLDQMPNLFQGSRRPKRDILNVYALVTRSEAKDK